jgi:hypothetical protein
MPGGRISFTERATDHTGLDSMHHASKASKEEDEKKTSNAVSRWWVAILEPGGGWEATIAVGRNKYSSPWSASLHTTTDAYMYALLPLMSSVIRSGRAPSFSTALQYVLDYCAAHGVSHLCEIALSAALQLPNHTKDITLPVPDLCGFLSQMETSILEKGSKTHWTQEDRNIGKLLALGCNVRGITALLLSVLYEPCIPYNSASPWIQSALAVLESVQSEAVLLKILSARAPKLEFLWAGALILGAHTSLFSEARVGLIPVELHSAAWTGSAQSFIQEPIAPYLGSESDSIRRADECRLVYLCQTECHSRVPNCQWSPFGSIPMQEADIELRLHYNCNSHALIYGGWAWKCTDGDVVQSSAGGSCGRASSHPADGNGVYYDEVDYDVLDLEDEIVSQNATRSILTWLRSEGYPASEKSLFLHEWLQPYDSDDDGELEDLESSRGRDDQFDMKVAAWLNRAVAMSPSSPAARSYMKPPTD